MYVRFGGECPETCHSDMARRWTLSLQCNDGVLNSLLTALNERKYTNEGRTYPIPTISFFAASNSMTGWS